MNPLEGLLFLFAGVVVFAIGIAWMLARERSNRLPRRTVAHFQRSRRAMRKIFRAQLARSEAARARARSEHPARRRRTHAARTHRRSA